MGHLTNALRQVAKTATSTVLPVLKEQTVKLGKFNINYTEVGHGAHKVVLIPAVLGTITSHYKYQINGFNKDKFTLVIFDPQGYGKSIPPERILTKDFYQKDADTAYELMEYLNVPKYSVMGWCAGGASSMLLASQHPEKVKKLVVWCTNSYVTPDDIKSIKVGIIALWAPAGIKEGDNWGEHIKQTMSETYSVEGFYRLLKQWIDNMVEFWEAEPDICRDQLKHISCPTYILYGQKDRLVHPAHFPLLCHHIKNSKYFLYPEGKHDIHMKYADDFNQRVQEFLFERIKHKF